MRRPEAPTLPMTVGNEPTPPPPDDKDDGDEAKREVNRSEMDPELRAMGAVLRLLKGLSDPAKGRVILYLYSRYVETMGTIP